LNGIKRCVHRSGKEKSTKVSEEEEEEEEKEEKEGMEELSSREYLPV